MPNPVVTMAIDMDSGAAAYDAESWATGRRGGVDVPSSDPAYHNNARYYAELLGLTLQESEISGIRIDGVVGAGITRFGVCSTAGSTQEKTVSITEGTFQLTAGARVTVKFTNINTASSPKLNVNGTGAKYILIEGLILTNGPLYLRTLRGVRDFVYNATSDRWEMIGGVRPEAVTEDGSAAGLTMLGLVSAYDKYVWNNKGSVSSVAAGIGLTTASGDPVTGTGTVKARLKSETALSGAAAAATETSGRIYAVVTDSAGDLAVVVPWTDTQPGAMTGAGSSTAGAAGLVPAPAAGDDGKFLTGAGTWAAITIAGLGGKPSQEAVSDPAASGTAVEFISGITQNGDGVITPSKKTVRTMAGATADAAGTTGLAPAPAAGDQAKVLAGSGAWTAPSQDGVSGISVNRYGVCSTAAGTAAKEVSITDGTFTLAAGARVSVYFSNANTASSPKLNVNGTGSKSIRHRGSTIGSGDNKALLRGLCDFVYSGSYWHFVGNYVDTNTVPTAYCTTAAATAAKTATCTGFVLSSGMWVPVLFTKENTSTDLGLSLNINSTGAKQLRVSSGGEYGSAAFPAGFYLLWYEEATENNETVGYYYLRTDGGLPGPMVPMRKNISVTIPTGETELEVTDAWITADTCCYAHDLATKNLQTTVSWEFDENGGAVTFTLGAALSSALTFEFGMMR